MKKATIAVAIAMCLSTTGFADTAASKIQALDQRVRVLESQVDRLLAFQKVAGKKHICMISVAHGIYSGSGATLFEAKAKVLTLCSEGYDATKYRVYVPLVSEVCQASGLECGE